ncbi:MAG UNVERIFIED_CONTAM: hypothetical protein LVR18_35215 [Planctomycetaceae bacterium]
MAETASAAFSAMAAPGREGAAGECQIPGGGASGECEASGFGTGGQVGEGGGREVAAGV